jgi:DNA invertase Pin-like site-specific DNA recombinase
MKTAALYLRCSDARGTISNQRPEVEQLARARGFDVLVYEEVESAAKARPVFDQMLKDARAGHLQAVAVWALDRLHRSMKGAIDDVLELDRLGVRVISVQESWLDNDGPVRPLLVAIFGWVAEQERARLIDRTRAGLARVALEARDYSGPPKSIDPAAKGWPAGRPRASQVLLHAASDLVATGASIRAAARAKGMSEATLHRFRAQLQQSAA